MAVLGVLCITLVALFKEGYPNFGGSTIIYWDNSRDEGLSFYEWQKKKKHLGSLAESRVILLQHTNLRGRDRLDAEIFPLMEEL